MTKSKTVLLWGGKDILSSSIELFLATQEDWRVICISNTEGLDALTHAVETTHSAIVIIYQESNKCPSNLPLQLLKDSPAIKVITVNLENNTMEVFNKKKVIVKHANDLISVIENNH